MYIFYPSCNFQKRFPETAAVIREYMQKQKDVRIAGCCQKTFDLPKEGDIIITVCNSCMHLLNELCPGIPQISLYEFMLGRTDFVWPDYKNTEMTIQDCFRARGMHALQDAVRTCAQKMHIQYVEMKDNRDGEMYDGSFLLHEPYPQNMRDAPKYFAEYLPPYTTPMPKEQWPEVYRKQAEKYTTEAVLGYCNTCCASLKEVGVQVYHLAELIFGTVPLERR